MKKLKSSTDHFTGREREALHGIRRQLSDEVRPLLVLCLGSMATTTLRRNLSAVSKAAATDFRFVCELVLVLPEGANLLKDRAGLRALERRLSRHADVRLVALTPEGLAVQLASGRNARINVHSDAIVLYERDGTLGKVVQMVAERATTVPYRNDEIASAAPRNDVAHNDGEVASSCLHAMTMPVGLSAEERADPLSVVVAFFRMYPLPEARERVAAWLQAVVSEPSWPVVETGRHLDFYVSVCRLVSCAALLRGYATPLWVLQMLEGKDGGAGMPPQSLYCPQEVADAWAYFPNHLSRAEFGAPGVVFRDLFAEHAPGVWLSALYDLFGYSLTDCTPAEVDDDCDAPGMMVALNRLIEAAHLLAVWTRRAGAGRASATGVPPASSVKRAPVTSVL